MSKRGLRFKRGGEGEIEVVDVDSGIPEMLIADAAKHLAEEVDKVMLSHLVAMSAAKEEDTNYDWAHDDWVW